MDNERSSHDTWPYRQLGVSVVTKSSKKLNCPFLIVYFPVSANLCSRLLIQQMWLITNWCTARLHIQQGTKAECQPKSKHNCKTHLQSYGKIKSYTIVGTFRQKEWYLLCRTDEIHPSCFRSPPSLATRDLVLERVALIHRPACTHKTQKRKSHNIRRKFVSCSNRYMIEKWWLKRWSVK